ncbi:MAG: glycosyltransferase family 2 protein [Candidatus Diapherotrites archaeon]
MKLIITIPAYNEENTVAKVIEEIPKKIEGISKIEILVIDDGSTDKTSEAAKKAGAQVLINKKRLGLARTFKKGLENALNLGADIIINTDADFQYNQKQIPLLIKPILNNEADIVLGSRFKGWIEEMPLQKKIGNRIVSWIVRNISGLPISDAQTGFRAFSREAALQLNIFSDYTYTQETILQAAEKKLIIREAPIDFRKRKGSSRLISNIFVYAKKAFLTILIAYLNYKPLKVFLGIGSIFFLLGLLLGSRVLIHYFNTGLVSPYLPTAILTAVLLIFGFQIIVIGLIAEMIKYNRKIEEELLYKIKKMTWQ